MPTAGAEARPGRRPLSTPSSRLCLLKGPQVPASVQHSEALGDPPQAGSAAIGEATPPNFRGPARACATLPRWKLSTHAQSAPRRGGWRKRTRMSGAVGSGATLRSTFDGGVSSWRFLETRSPFLKEPFGLTFPLISEAPEPLLCRLLEPLLGAWECTCPWLNSRASAHEPDRMEGRVPVILFQP